MSSAILHFLRPSEISQLPALEIQRNPIAGQICIAIQPA